MSGHSIRLRFVGWLLRHIDKLREHMAQHLRGDEVKPHANANLGLGLIANVDYGFGHRQVEHVVNYPVLDKQGWHDGGQSAVLNDPGYVAYLQRLAASNNDIVAHKGSPLGASVFSLNQPQFYGTPEQIMRPLNASVESDDEDAA